MQTEPDHYRLQQNAFVVRYIKCTFGANEVSFLGHHITPEEVNTLPEKGRPKDLKWGPLQEAAFCNAKKVLSTAAAITFYIPHALLLFSTDASDITIGVVLQLVINVSPRALAFFSRKLSKADRIGLFYLRS
ncbi:uncharacterized protein [Palaemon carinicauda]|uniref:uncharacterized protein n=1 Tax=Palaemon carinicauda TaxID=392227 RepID=UPI0035B5E40C